MTPVNSLRITAVKFRPDGEWFIITPIYTIEDDLNNALLTKFMDASTKCYKMKLTNLATAVFALRFDNGTEWDVDAGRFQISK